jgi:hypothetical protein
MDSSLHSVGPPIWTAEEVAFAEKLQKTLPGKNLPPLASAKEIRKCQFNAQPLIGHRPHRWIIETHQPAPTPDERSRDWRTFGAEMDAMQKALQGAPGKPRP